MVFLAVICSTGVARGSDQEFGHPLFRTFTAHDYGELGQIFAVTEDLQGRMLFGAANALLAFDNSRWQKTPAPGTGFIRSLAVDSRGLVWFSSSTQIGYLSRMDGEYQVVKVAEGWFGADSRILLNGSQIYIIGEGGLFLWNNGQISKLPCPLDLRNPFGAGVVHGKIWVADQSGSIYELDEGQFKKIAQSLTKTGDVRAIVDCPIDDGLIVRTSGIFRKNGATLIPWKTDVDPLLARSATFSAQWIMGKFLAVLVQDSGVYLLDRQGQLVEILTVDSGLADAGFESLGEDRDGEIWVGTDTEITRVQCGSGYTEFDHESGLPKGFVTDVGRYQGRIYTATQRGVYLLRPPDDTSPSAHFFRLGERNDRFFGLTVDGSRAFAISEIGAYVLDPANSRLERIGSGGVTIVPSAVDRNRLFLSTVDGLEAIRNDNGRWYSEGLLSQLPSSIPAVAEDEQGDLFLCTVNGEFYRVELKKDAQPLFRNARIERLPDLKNSKVPSADGPICKWQRQMLFIGDDRVWKLSPDKRGVQPFDLIARSLPGRNVNLMIPSRITEDYVWVGSRPPNAGPETGFEVGRLYSSGRYEALPHAVSYPLGVINNIWDETADGRPVAWIAGDYGLMRVALDQPTCNKRKFELYASQILSADGEIIPLQDGKRLPQWIETDPHRLRQVLCNLLGNAMKFTAKGEVALRVDVASERFRFEVKDTGQGIPREDLPSMFKPFFQAANNQLVGQGVGLGLHISKQIAELLGGTIEIVSELGEGSTFTLDIPRWDADPANRGIDLPQIIGYEGPRRKILIVDDETLNRSLLRELLATVGFESDEASSPKEALCLLNHGFDAVISEICMPECDGHTFCRNLRHPRRLKILLSALVRPVFSLMTSVVLVLPDLLISCRNQYWKKSYSRFWGDI